MTEPKRLTTEEDKFYIEHNVAPPTRIGHGGTVEELAEEYKVVAHHFWRQEGTQLICVCEMGRHVSFIPATHMLTGTGPDGLPLLTKIQV